MPSIHLKPNSAEFAEENRKPKAGTCDMPGCGAEGDHRAPKDRSLSDYYRFCFDHARDYNRAWNYFSGMNGKEVEDHIINSIHGDRPTWRYDQDGMAAQNIHRKAWQTYHYTDDEPAPSRNAHFGGDKNSAEYEALIIMGLEAPVTLDDIKTRYKKLAKKYHPDLNRGDKKSEELLKGVNMAYTILKLAYQKYEDLPDKT